MQFNQEKQITECIFEFAIRSSLEVAIECRTEEGYHLSPSGDCVLAVTGGINRSPRSPTAGRQRNYKALLKSILNRRRNGRENWTDPSTIEKSQWSSQVNLPKKIRDY